MAFFSSPFFLLPRTLFQFRSVTASPQLLAPDGRLGPRTHFKDRFPILNLPLKSAFSHAPCTELHSLPIQCNRATDRDAAPPLSPRSTQGDSLLRPSSRIFPPLMKKPHWVAPFSGAPFLIFRSPPCRSRPLTSPPGPGVRVFLRLNFSCPFAPAFYMHKGSFFFCLLGSVSFGPPTCSCLLPIIVLPFRHDLRIALFLFLRGPSSY